MPPLLVPVQSPPREDREAETLGDGDLPKATQRISLGIGLEFSILGCKAHEISTITYVQGGLQVQKQR